MADGFVLLDKSHDRTSFDCGVPALNQFLQQQALQASRRDLSRTYVYATDDGAIRSYVTIAADALPKSALPASLRKNAPQRGYPAVLVGRLAVAESAKGQGLGTLTLVHAVKAAVRLSNEIGFHAVVVRAKDEAAAQFYEHHAFERLVDHRHLMLPMGRARRLF